MQLGPSNRGQIRDVILTLSLFTLVNSYNDRDYLGQTAYNHYTYRPPSIPIRHYAQRRQVYPQVIPNDPGRQTGPDIFTSVSETLGAINTLGRYLVNVTTNGNFFGTPVTGELPGAIYTLSKNVLGRNVTDSLAPFVREAIPIRRQPLIITTTTTTKKPDEDSRICTTPEGTTGYCNDLSNCPQLLLNLSNLRQSLCFKNLFEPGVCCPSNESQSATIAGSKITEPTSTNLPYTSTEEPISSIDGNFVDTKDCGQPEFAKFRVVGGEESLPGRWPWMAAIFLHGNRRTEFWCGGSLISAKHVLTAAHCTRDAHQRPFLARQFTVRLGDIDLKRDDESSDPVTFKVTDVKAHPNFNRVGFYNDIAVMVLDRKARRSKFVIPICLPPEELQNEKFAGQKTTVVGWGTTYYGGKESTVQRQAILPVWRNQDCNDAYYQPITSNFLCAGYAQGGIDACQGDSGGPLMINWDSFWIQVGIVSFGNKCGEPGYPGVYTRITEYLNWIKENTKD